jgi:hypothetical protein
MSGHEDAYLRDVTESDVDPTGEMGVSSEREGYVASDSHAPTGLRPTTAARPRPGREPPEETPGNEEPVPVGIPPKAGYASRDPRSKDGPAYEPESVTIRREMRGQEPERRAKRRWWRRGKA